MARNWNGVKNVVRRRRGPMRKENVVQVEVITDAVAGGAIEKKKEDFRITPPVKGTPEGQTPVKDLGDK